jgi:MFS family permease
MRRLLAIRDARLYLAGQTLSLVGDTSLWLALGIWAKTLTGSSGAAGLVFLAFTAPQLLGPLSGVLVDRVRRRPLLLAVNLLTAVAVLPLLLVRDAGDVWILYAVMVLYGFSYTLLAPAQSALLATLLPDELLGRGNAALQTVREGLRLVAPLAGAGLFTWLGGSAVAALDAGTFLAAAIALALMRVDEPPPARAPEGRWAELSAGVRRLGHDPALRSLTTAAVLCAVAFGFAESLVFAVVDDGLGRPPSFIGVILGAQGVGAILAGLAAPRALDRLGEVAVFRLGLALSAVGLLVFAAPVVGGVLAAAGVFGAGLPWVVVGSATLIQRSSPLHLQGRVFAAFEWCFGIPQTASIALGAVLVGVVPFRELLAATALLTVLAVAVARAPREARRAPRPRREPAATAPGRS